VIEHVDQVDEYVEEIKSKPKHDDSEEPIEPAWNGRTSKASLAVGALLNRDGHLVTAGSACVDCLARGKTDHTHQFHLRASKNADGTWCGPEAEHRLVLKSIGALRGTPEAERRLEQEAELAYIRGVEPASKCRNCGATIPRGEGGQLAASCDQCSARNGLPELKTLSLPQLKKLWGSAAKHEVAVELEKGQIRDEVRQLSEALSSGVVVPLKELIRELVGDAAAAKAKK
jgi:hypothetical protein